MRVGLLGPVGVSGLVVSLLLGSTVAAPVHAQDIAAEELVGEDTQGLIVLEERPDLVPILAERNGRTTKEMAVDLRDETTRVSANGSVYIAEPLPDPELLARAQAQTQAEGGSQAGPFPDAQTFFLHSNPGSNRVIYLDFNGQVVSGTDWAVDDAGPFTALPWSIDAAPTFSTAERDAIQSIFLRVAEDYAPFNVDVTTEDPGLERIDRASVNDVQYGTRVLITDSPSFIPTLSTTGLAFRGAFDSLTPPHASRQPAWVFATGVDDNTKMMAEVISHEAGHTVGLSHDATTTTPYYTGHDMWSPIMGSGYYRPVVQWSRGEYADANNLEDDFMVMAGHGVSVRSDDHTNDLATATPITTTASGIITPAASLDADLFKFDAPRSGRATFAATPASVSPNLDVALRLYSSAPVTQLAVSDPPAAAVTQDTASGLGASLTFDVIAGTSYYIQVLPTSVGTGITGFTTYGSLGQYSVKVSAPQSAICPPDDSFEPNDLSAAGWPLTSGETLSGVACGNNDDYFTFGAAVGDAVSVEVAFSHAVGDIDVQLFNPDGSLAVTAESQDDNESVAFTAIQSGPHVVRVYGYQGAQNEYALTTTVTPPFDSDGDGVADPRDQCPTVAGPASNGGCPVTPPPPADTDGDGIVDGVDQCPAVAGPASNGGCPVTPPPPADTDGDGIVDGVDQCPAVAGATSNGGCPPPPADSDGDGLPDTQDQCPSLVGAAGNNGCPLPPATIASPVTAPAATPSVVVRVKATSGRSKLFVDVDPNKGSGYWRFQVQRLQADKMTWRGGKTYRTKGKNETRTINLPKGTYRVVVDNKYGYQGTASAGLDLKK